MKKHIAIHCIALALATVQVDQANAFSGSTLPQVVAKICKKKPNYCNPLSWYPKPTPTIIVQVSGRRPGSSITRLPDALPEDEIIELMEIAAEPGGLKVVGQVLGRINLPEEVLEDTWIRIAVGQGRISRTIAEGMFKRLSRTPGFRTTLRKICGNNPSGTIGHLNELEIADAAVRKGFKVRGIGIRFDDIGKGRPTDIDVIIEKGGKIFPIEAKKYSTQQLGMDMVRADMDSLVEYRRFSGNNRTIPVFSMTQVPRGNFTLLQHEAQKRGIHLVFGSLEDQIVQIEHLLRLT